GDCTGFLSAGWKMVACGTCGAGFFTASGDWLPQDTPGVLPCNPGDKVGCKDNVVAQCSFNNGADFAMPSVHVFPMDSAINIPVPAPCPGTLCCPPMANPSSACPKAIWTNFGAQTLTVTE